MIYLLSFLIIIAFCLFGFIVYKFKYKSNVINTSCIICGKSTNSNKLTTCSIKCENISKRKLPKLFIQRAKSNINRQSNITGYELNYNQWLQTLQYFNYKCAYCHKPITQTNVHMDHFIPVNNGGTFIFKNILPACHECNLAKSSKSPSTFTKSINSKFINHIKQFVNF